MKAQVVMAETVVMVPLGPRVVQVVVLPHHFLVFPHYLHFLLGFRRW
jgi:hypothetical protein